jgi:hypothetical protein
VQRSLYYTQIEIGSPSKGYYVQVDTGSDILWVNCIRCDGCPTTSGLGVMLHRHGLSVQFNSFDDFWGWGEIGLLVCLVMMIFS